MANIKELIKFEYAKCTKDPVYFIRKYCVIQHPKKGKIPFDLYPFQEKTLQDFLTYRKNIILKSRQLGISTLTSAYALWLALFQSDKNILVMATKQGVAKNIITKISEMYVNLPPWLKNSKATSEFNKLSIRFENGSQIKAESTTKESGRSEALSLLILDECAFIEHAEELWTASQPTLSTGGDVIMLSTPNGMGNLFHKIWVGAKAKENGFNPIRLHWTLHPDRNQEWRDEQTKELGAKKAAQECDCFWGDSLVTIRNISTGEIENISLENLYKRIHHSEYTRQGYEKIREELNQLNIYTKEETRDLLLENNYYLSLFGRAKNRTLIKQNPKLYKSIYEHTKELEEELKKQDSYFGNYCFTNRILFIVEHNYLIESLRCQCGKKLSFTKYCRECPEPKKTCKGHSEETKTKIRISAVNYIETCKGKCVPRYNKKSIEILESKAKDLGISDLQHAENGGEFYIPELGFFVDGYSKEKNIVFEFDEKHHYENGNLRESDLIRQNQIESLLGCTFVRIKEEDYAN